MIFTPIGSRIDLISRARPMNYFELTLVKTSYFSPHQDEEVSTHIFSLHVSTVPFQGVSNFAEIRERPICRAGNGKVVHILADLNTKR